MDVSRTARRAPGRWALVVAVVLALAGWVAAAPASAAPVDLFLEMTSGEVSVGETTFALPAGGGWNGTGDDETGELTGSFSLPSVTTPVESFPGASVTLSFQSLGPSTGTVDLDTWEVEMATQMRLQLVVSLDGVPVTTEECGIEPIALVLTGVGDPDAQTVTLTASGFTLPPSSGCGDIGPLIDQLLVGDTSLVLSLTRVESPVEPPPTVVPTVPASPPTEPPADPPPAPAAQPVTAPAQFTG